MEKRVNICAVVVTYNRKQLLCECIEAIINQTYPVKKIIIVDNNSTDGTKEELKKKGMVASENIIYMKLDKNVGGAGGFHEGMKKAMEAECSWIWIMDDDTIPKKEALEELISSLEIIKDKKISYLASCVYGEKGENMNVPNINLESNEENYPDWYNYLKYGIVKIKEATFVSLLINKKAIESVGLPIKEYFIWGDDTEYTLRLNKYYGASYLIGNSEVIHKRKITKRLSIYNEIDDNRINFYYYMIRNNLINKKNYYGKIECLKFFVKEQLDSIKILLNPKAKKRIKKFNIIHKALFNYLFSTKTKIAFKNRFNNFEV